MTLGCDLLYGALAALPTSSAPMPASRVDIWCPLDLLPLEMLSEGLIHDLSDGQVIEVCLAPDGFDPALFDMEGSSLNAFQVQKNARFIRKNIMELICIPWIVPVGLAILCGVCIYGWIRTDYRWRMSAETLLHQLEEDQGGSR